MKNLDKESADFLLYREDMNHRLFARFGRLGGIFVI